MYLKKKTKKEKENCEKIGECSQIFNWIILIDEWKSWWKILYSIYSLVQYR